MSQLVLKAETREGTGKKAAKQLRRDGKIPCIYYAHSEKSISLTVDEKEFRQFLASSSGLFDVAIDKSKPKKCIIRQVQFDPVKNVPVHVDIMGVRLKEKLTVSVPVKLLGEPLGVKEEGGSLTHSLHEVEVSCLPLDIPDSIEIDVSHLNIGDSIHVKDLPIDKFEILNDPEVLVAGVVIVRATLEVVEEVPELEGEEGEEGEGAEEETEDAEKTEQES